MVYLMLLAHLLGDYVFQWDGLARLKMRSLWGVVAHGGIVTAVTLLLALLAEPTWWPYALLIGATHTAIDVVRARLLHPQRTSWEMVWYLLDQVAHLGVIGLAVAAGGDPWQAGLTALGLPLNREVILYAAGYLLLAQPAWVLLRFVVRGIWGPEAAPRLGLGEKYGPMAERVVIATSVVLGQPFLIPVVLLPRRLASVQVREEGVALLVRPTGSWLETLLGVALAVVVGVFLRML